LSVVLGAIARPVFLPFTFLRQSSIAARRHSFFGHIRRLPANTPAHKAPKLAVDSKSGDIPQHDWNRPAGRPRTTWMSQIVRDTGLTAADAWALADDRSTWRALRPTAGYAQQSVSGRAQYVGCVYYCCCFYYTATRYTWKPGLAVLDFD